MDYDRTLAYLHAQLPMFHRIGKAAYKADLNNTHALMDLLGHPERGLRCVHVAGTNGKGSTCHMLASVLHEAGYRTGLYTSPHLKDFRERIKVNGQMIPREKVSAFVALHQEAFAAIEPSFFEWTVALAFDHFREERVDIAVIETGLGGRLDSTNVVDPEVSVITNISWDHADLLGNSLEAIAAEKAGIIKPGKPVVVGDPQGMLAAVFEARANALSAPIHFVDQRTEWDLAIDLASAVQELNARTALTTLRVLQGAGWRIEEEHIARGLAHVVNNTGLRGRWETIGRDPLIIADVSHNEAGLRHLRGQIDLTSHENLHVVFGAVNDKDLGRMLAELPANATYYFCKADIPRGMDVSVLQGKALSAGLQGEKYPSVAAAFAAAQKAASAVDLVIVTGSVFVVAEVL